MISKLGWRGLAAIALLVVGILVVRDLVMEKPPLWVVYGPVGVLSLTLAVWPRPGG